MTSKCRKCGTVNDEPYEVCVWCDEYGEEK
jgi:uncharacterized OB-fold protein